MSDDLQHQKMAYDSGTLFGTQIKASKNINSNAPATVPNNSPNTILYDPRQIWNMPDSMLAHEQEHVLDNRASSRYGNGWNKDQAMYDTYVQAGGNPEKDYQQGFRSGLATPDVQKQLEKLGLSDGYTSGNPVKTKDGLINGSSLHELLASLSGYEQAKNVDLTKDPVLGKALFSDPAFTAAYKASTGLRTERLDAKDLPPYTPDMQAGQRPNDWADPALWKNLSNALPPAPMSVLPALSRFGGKK